MKRRFLAQTYLGLLQLPDLILIGSDQCGAIRLNDAVHELVRLPLDLLNLLLGAGDVGTRQLTQAIPDFLQHAIRHLVKIRCRRHTCEKGLEVAFDFLGSDRLAIQSAASGVAKIVRIFAIAAGGPGRRHRLFAAFAGDETAQRKIQSDILAHRRLGDALEAILHFAPGREIDERFMLAGQHGNIPLRHADVPRVDRARQKFTHTLEMHLAIFAARISGLAFKMAFHFDLTLEPTGGISLECVGDDRGERFVADEEFPVAGNFLEAVSNGCDKAPVARHHARLHLLQDLALVLRQFQFPLRRDDRLDELALGCVLEIEVQALDGRAPDAERAAQLEMEFGIPRESLQIVENDDVLLAAFALRIEIAQKRHHTRAFHEVDAARYVVGKNRLDLVAPGLGVAAAA